MVLTVIFEQPRLLTEKFDSVLMASSKRHFLMRPIKLNLFFKKPIVLMASFGIILFSSGAKCMANRIQSTTLVARQSQTFPTTLKLTTMTKNWNKLEENRYAFIVDNKKVGEMSLEPKSLQSAAICRIGGDNFTIKRTGFWKSRVEISDKDGMVVAKTYSEKWLANSSILEYDGKKYKLLLRNNPLAEYAIMDGEQTVLAYGLQHDKETVSVRIAGDLANSDVLFDFLLWYLFVPIVVENSGDDFVFQLLLTAQ